MMPDPRADVRELGFDASWEAITGHARAMRLSGVCEGCANYRVCHPCAAIAYAETGSTTGIPTYLCRTTRELRRLAQESAANN